MRGKEVNDTPGVVGVTLHAQTERLQPLKQYPCVERRNGSSRISQDDSTYAGDKSGLSGHVCKHGAMVARIRLGQCRILVGIGLPVKASGIHDYSAQAGTMAANELRGRMHHDIGTMLDRTYEKRCAERIVHDHYGIVAVSDFRNTVNVGDVGIRIAERLYYNGFRIVPESRIYSLEVRRIHYGIVHPLGTERMRYEIVRTAIEVVGRYDMVARLPTFCNAYVMAAAPLATASPATPFSSAATRSSRTAWVELVRRP